MDKRGMLTIKEIIELVLLVIVILGVILPVTMIVYGILSKEVDALALNNFKRLVIELKDLEEKKYSQDFQIIVPIYMSEDEVIRFYTKEKTTNKDEINNNDIKIDDIPGLCVKQKACVCLNLDKDRPEKCEETISFDKLDFSKTQGYLRGEENVNAEAGRRITNINIQMKINGDGRIAILST